MRKRDGLLLAPILLVGAMMASLAVRPEPLPAPVIWTVTALSGAAIYGYVLIARRRRDGDKD